jgi:hypothetical protein
LAYTLEELLAVGLPPAMECLIEAADRRETVSYADMVRYIAKRTSDPRFARAWHDGGDVAGTLMNRILEVAPTAPPINTLVVRAGTNLPSTGADAYVERYLNVEYSKLDDAQKREIINRIHESVWDFPRWRQVGKLAFGRKFVPPEPVSGESDGKAERLGFGGPPESENHLRLKKYVASHPREFGAPKDCKKGLMEYRLPSADEMDVLFMSTREQVVVEVKSKRSNSVDLERGVFQCVKYRAVLQAKSDVSNPESRATVRALLVSEHPLGSKLAKWATKLDVEVRVISPLR